MQTQMYFSRNTRDLRKFSMKKRVKEKEVVLVAKTTTEKYGTVKKLVEKNHPYAIPCIVKISVEANAGYAKWLRECLSEKSK